MQELWRWNKLFLHNMKMKIVNFTLDKQWDKKLNFKSLDAN